MPEPVSHTPLEWIDHNRLTRVDISFVIASLVTQIAGIVFTLALKEAPMGVRIALITPMMIPCLGLLYVLFQEIREVAERVFHKQNHATENLLLPGRVFSAIEI